jgi:putative CocE/NonD family hydrolase
VILLFTAAYLKPLPGEALNAAGVPVNSSHYISTADGTRIAVDLWLPVDLDDQAQIPALIEGSRYWRATRVTALVRLLNLFGGSAPGSEPSDFAHFFTSRDYAYLTVEVRGTGTDQPWSNGRVGAVGVSYAGTTAELMTTLQHPALKAVAPMYSDFDAQYGLVTPGGAYQPAFVSAWNDLVSAMDRDDLCGVAAAMGETMNGFICQIAKAFAGGAKPVNGDMSLLADAIAEHDSPDVEDVVKRLEYRDSSWGNVDYGTVDTFPYGRKIEIETSGVPMYIVSGWSDAATTDGALARFASFSNAQTVTIGPFSHGGGLDTDPYQPLDGELAMSRDDQLESLEAFFARYLHRDEPAAVSSLQYFVQGSSDNGSGQWRQVNAWPPVDLERVTWYLAANRKLIGNAPLATDAMDTLRVDFASQAPGATRWLTQLGGSDVYYQDRAATTDRLLFYDTPPFETDTELTGNVVVDFWLTSDLPDGTVHVYLDDMAPDGEARYLTEGLLRLIHRKIDYQPFYPTFGPAHSFLERDAEPMPAGQQQRVSFSLFATSALIRAGHRLRVSIAGADAVSFARYPSEGPPPVWQLHRSIGLPSSVSLPIRPGPATASPPSADTAPVRPEETPASSD